MNNLRITPKRKSADTYGTGDYQSWHVYEIRRDWKPEELYYEGGRKINYAQSVIDAGVVIETLETEHNAKLLMNALKEEALAAQQATRPATQLEIKVLEYLNRLRDSGVTNMFGAAAYIVSEFSDEVDRKSAQNLLKLWMKNYNEQCIYTNLKTN